MNRLALITLFIASVLCFAKPLAWAHPQVALVAPSLTSMQIRTIKGDHRVTIDSSVKSNGLLVITIGGTGSGPSEFEYVAKLSATLGYRVLSVDYPNGVISTVCQPDPDPLCFDNYRNEIVTGAVASPLVDVDRHNSIENRIDALFAHLLSMNFSQWADLRTPNGILDWSKVVLVGHSQGAGHVAYLGKFHEVKRIVMTGGPHDKSEHGLAKWVVSAGATPRDRHFAFLHEDDFFGSALQVDVVRGLLGDSRAKIERIVDSVSSRKSAHLFMTDLVVHDPHNSLAHPRFENVWKPLLDSTY
ncbi:MAG: alpha/beta fold hydrolase [Bdellovibrionota bacterium]